MIKRFIALLRFWRTFVFGRPDYANDHEEIQLCGDSLSKEQVKALIGGRSARKWGQRDHDFKVINPDLINDSLGGRRFWAEKVMDRNRQVFVYVIYSQFQYPGIHSYVKSVSAGECGLWRWTDNAERILDIAYELNIWSRLYQHYEIKKGETEA